MFMDSRVSIPKGTPKDIRQSLDYLQELFDSDEEGHDILWDNFWEGVETDIKEAVGSGRLSEHDARQIFKRYGFFD